MSIADTIREEVAEIFRTRWKTRDGRVVPETDDIQLGMDAVKLDGAVLYADLVGSTELVDRYRDTFAAEIYKAYLSSACRVIREGGGEITAFDGDRVMAVFLGSRKNSAAAQAALQINYTVSQIVNPEIRKHYSKTTYQVRQVVGVDSGELFVARTGIRDANDLVWVGRAANYAAKLCALRNNDYATLITETVYSKLSDGAKFGGSPRSNMWEKFMWDEMGVPAYGSRFWWRI